MFKSTWTFLLLLSVGVLPTLAESAPNSYEVKWMWGDANVGGSHALARKMSLNWASYKTVKGTIADLQEEERRGAALGGGWDNRRRRVDIVIKDTLNGETLVDTQVSSLYQSIQMLRKWKNEDTAAQEKQRIKEESKRIRHLVQWMWGDAGIAFANMNPLRWSTWKSPEDTIAELHEQNSRKVRPVHMMVKRTYGDDIYDDGQPWDLKSVSVAEAVRDIEKLSESQDANLRSDGSGLQCAGTSLARAADQWS